MLAISPLHFAFTREMGYATSWVSSIFTEDPPEHIYVDMQILIHNFSSVYLRNVAIQNTLLVMIFSCTLFGTICIAHYFEIFKRDKSHQITRRSFSQEPMVNHIENEEEMISSSGDDSDDERIGMYKMDHRKGTFLPRLHK